MDAEFLALYVSFGVVYGCLVWMCVQRSSVCPYV